MKVFYVKKIFKKVHSKFGSYILKPLYLQPETEKLVPKRKNKRVL